MQTFLPYPDIQRSVQCLDTKRLGKQRVEAYQLISAITGRLSKAGKPYKGWINHPITRMWCKNVNALKLYYNLTIDEWIKRGFRNTMEKEEVGEVIMPDWFGYEPFHASHRSNLLRKNFDFYSKYNWKDCPADLYLWYDPITKDWYSIV